MPLFSRDDFKIAQLSKAVSRSIRVSKNLFQAIRWKSYCSQPARCYDKRVGSDLSDPRDKNKNKIEAEFIEKTVC